MKSRDRFRKIFNFEEPDRVPIDIGCLASTIEREAYEDLKRYLGIEEPTEVFSRDHTSPSEEILRYFKVDTRYVHFSLPRVPDPTVKSEEDEWGITWRKNEGSKYYEPVEGPFRDEPSVKDVKSFDWPTNISDTTKKRWKSKAKKLYEETDYAVIADLTGIGVFEQASQMRGFEKILRDLVGNPEFTRQLLNKVTEVQMIRFEAWLDAIGPFVEAVWVSDDLGMQDRPLISPNLFREMVKPNYKQLYRFIKEQAKVKIIHHSDGAIRPFIDDLIEVGVDGINPLQVSAKGMNPAKLKQEFGERLVFWGGSCDSQSTLPNGAAEEIKREVKQHIKELAPGGGYVFSSIHNIQPGTPPENIVALFEAALKYGGY